MAFTEGRKSGICAFITLGKVDGMSGGGYFVLGFCDIRVRRIYNM